MSIRDSSPDNPTDKEDEADENGNTSKDIQGGAANNQRYQPRCSENSCQPQILALAAFGGRDEFCIVSFWY